MFDRWEQKVAIADSRRFGRPQWGLPLGESRSGSTWITHITGKRDFAAHESAYVEVLIR
jgi:hypothetical protein